MDHRSNSLVLSVVKYEKCHLQTLLTLHHHVSCYLEFEDLTYKVFPCKAPLTLDLELRAQTCNVLEFEKWI